MIGSLKMLNSIFDSLTLYIMKLIRMAKIQVKRKIRNI